MEQQATEVPAAQALAEGKLGWYRTRDGGLAEVLTIMHPRLEDEFPVNGFIRGDPEAEMWTFNGRAVRDDIQSQFDLITYLGTEKPKHRVKRTAEVVRYVNVYPDATSEVHPIREIAEAKALAGRIACVELRGSYEVEEKVDE